ncbi:cupin domain-containing protein [Bosea sp. (in: a-proteobacteria)]|uniref:cupin domain-containing protein n=1 Tax=Bosea sp. (in: a-proteobacteria) TaxID=1871050 RepID=UPI002FCC6C1A
MTGFDGLDAAGIIRLLELKPHPEGGHYRETFRDPQGPEGPEGRSFSTAIYYLLDAGETSHWHRVDAAEIWHHYAGAPLAISLSPEGGETAIQHLGSDLSAGQRPQIVVPAGCWQSAATLGGWTLVGCTVAPGFAFSGFEMARPGWRPTGG